MFGYDKKWNDIQKIDPKDYLNTFKDKADLIIIATQDVSVYETSGLTLYLRLLFATLNLNGPLTEQVFNEKKKLLSAAIGYEIIFDEAQKLSLKAKKECANRYEFEENINRLFNKIPNSIKEDIVTLCLILGSIDKRPTYKVRTFLKRFYQ